MSPLRPIAYLAAALGASLGAACLNTYPQRVPGPLFIDPEDELPAAPRPGPALITVQRNSDPVWIRRPGERGDIAVPFYRKRERVTTGTRVRSGAGGRAEILWSPDATSLVLFDEGRVTLGDPERDEPVMRMHSVTRAVLNLTPEDRVILPGGARLAGDALEATGPVLLELTPARMLRVVNQSKRLASVGFRDLLIELAPGDSVDLPPLSSGAAPARGVEPARVEERGVALSYDGEVETGPGRPGLEVRASAPSALTAQGVTVLLEEGQAAVFSGLSLDDEDDPADRNAVP